MKKNRKIQVDGVEYEIPTTPMLGMTMNTFYVARVTEGGNSEYYLFVDLVDFTATTHSRILLTKGADREKFYSWENEPIAISDTGVLLVGWTADDEIPEEFGTVIYDSQED